MTVTWPPSLSCFLITRAVRKALKGQRPSQPLSVDAVRRIFNQHDPRLIPRRVDITPCAFAPGDWIAPTAMVNDGSAILYLHGGGFVACSPTTHRPLTAALAIAAQRPVLSLDYALAPEHPHPAAIEDALAAIRALLGAGFTRLAIAGDSAGGGLAVATLLAARAAGEAPLAAAALFSPWVDLTGSSGSILENDRRCAMFFAADFALGARLYAGDLALEDPRVSPLFADLAGLPPLLVHVARNETLRDDGLRLAERARAAGVPVEAETFAHVPHVWQMFAKVMPEARLSIQKAAAFLIARLAVSSILRADL